MSSYTISSSLDKSKVFILQKSEFKKRFDPFFYSPLNKLAILENTKLPKKKLSDVAELKRGKFSHRPRNDERYFGGTYPFIQTGEIVKASNNLGKIEYSQTLNELGLSVSKLFDEEVLLITIAANIGDTAILDYPACFPDSIVAISSKDKNVSLKYLNIYFKFLKKYLENLAPSAAQKNLTLEQLAPTPVIIPSFENQNKIIRIFDNYITQKQKNEVEAEKLLSSIDDYLLKELGIKLPEPKKKLKDRIFKTNLSKVSGNRIDCDYYFNEEIEISIKNGIYNFVGFSSLLTSLINGYDFRDYKEFGTPYIKVANVRKGNFDFSKMQYIEIDNSEISKAIQLKKGNILLTRKGTYGYSLCIEEDLDFVISSEIFYIELKHELINSKFLEIFFNSIVGQKQFERVKIGAIMGSLSQEAVKSLKIPLPSLSKQKEIAGHITGIRQQAQKLKDTTTELLKKASEEIEEILLN